MTKGLRDRILLALRMDGPLTDYELAQKLNAPRASVRRCRMELVVQQLVEKIHDLKRQPLATGPWFALWQACPVEENAEGQSDVP